MNNIGGYPGDDTSVEFLSWNVFTQDCYYNWNKRWICVDHPEGKKVFYNWMADVMLRGHSLSLKSSLLIKFCLLDKVSELRACGFIWNESNTKKWNCHLILSLISTSLCYWYSSLFPVKLCWNNDLVAYFILLFWDEVFILLTFQNIIANGREEEGLGNSDNTVLIPLVTGRQIAECTDCWND